MTDIASLGLRIDSGPATKAADDLDRMSASARRAEGSARGLTGATDKAGKATSALADQAAVAATATRATGAGLSGLARSIVSVVNPTYVAGAAFTAMGLAMAQAAADAARASTQIEIGLSGIARASGVSADEVRRLSVEAADAGVATASSARAIALELAGTGRIGTEIIERAVNVGGRFAKTIGEDATAATKRLADALADPARGVDVLNKQLGVFDFATAQRIRSLAAQNRTFEAQREIMRGVETGIVDSAKSTWALERAWTATTSAVSSYIDQAMQAVEIQLGGGTTAQQLREAQEFLLENRNMPAWMRWLDGGKLDAAARKVHELANRLNDEEAERFATQMNVESDRIGRMIGNLNAEFGGLQRIRDQITDLTDASNTPAIVSGLGPGGESALQKVLNGLAMQEAFHKSSLEIAQEEHSVFIATTTARTAAQRADLAYQSTVNKLRREGNVDAERLAMMAAERVTIAANEREKRALEEQAFGRQEIIDKMKLEAEFVGKSTVEVAALRAEWEAVADAKRRAFERGETLSTGQMKTARTEAGGWGATIGAGTAVIEGRGLLQGAMSDYDREEQTYAQRLALLDQFNTSVGDKTAESTALRYAIEHDHQLTIAGLHAQTASRVASTFDALGSAIGGATKKQFEQQKALSIASAVLKGYESAVSSYAAGTAIGGPPLGVAFAAMSVAATSAMISQVKSASFSGGGRAIAPSRGGTGSAGPSPTALPAGPAAQKQIIQINATGSRYSREEFREIIEGINEAIRDGTRLVFNPI